MDLIDDELVLNIASYCDARSMLSLALTSKKYGSKPSILLLTSSFIVRELEEQQLNVVGQ